MEKNVIVTVTTRKNWAGDKYLLFSTRGGGDIAEVDFYPDHFRVYGYKTNGYLKRKTKAGAVSLAKRQCRVFLDAIGEKREIVFV